MDDPLTEILRAGARRLIAQAVEAEFETFLVSTVDLVLPDGRQRVVRHGHDPVREIQRNRPGRSAKAEGPRSRRDGGGADPVHLEYPARMGAAHQEPGRAVAGSLSARDFRRRLPGGPRRLARQGRAQPLRGGDRAPRASGSTNIGDGRSAICRRAITSTSGRTASICRRAWSRKPNACWC